MKRTKFLSLLVLTTLIFQIFPASILPASALSSTTKSFTWCDSGFTLQERNGKQQCVEERQPSEKKYEINSTVDNLEHFQNHAQTLLTIKPNQTIQRKSSDARDPLDAFLHSATDLQNRRMPSAIRQIKIMDASLGSDDTAAQCKRGSEPLNHCAVHAKNLYVGAEYTLNVTPETEGDYLALISADDDVRLNVISDGTTREILNKSTAWRDMYLQPVRLTAGTHTFEFLYNNKNGVGGMVADLIGPFKGTDELLGKDLNAIMNIISEYGFESDAKHTPKVWTKNNNGPHLLWSIADETEEPRFAVRDYNTTRKLKKTDYFTCNAPYVAYEKPDRSVVCERLHDPKKGEFSLYTKNDKKEQTDKARIQRNSQGTDVFSYKYALVDDRAQCNAGVTSFQSASANFESSNADDGILFDNESADGKYVCVAVSLEGESTPIGYIASKDVLKIDKTPPVITATDTTVDQNTPLSHVITVTDDSEVETTVEFPANNPGFTYDDTTKTIGGTPNKPGVYKLKIIATDKTQTQNKSEKEITITVADKTPPVITATDTTVDQNTPLSHVITVTDDSEVETTVEFPANNPGFTYDDTTKTIGGTPNKPGVYKLKIIATDKTQTQNKSEKEITITVKDKTAPKIDPIADKTLPPNQPITPIDITTDDPTAIISVDSTTLPPGLTFDSTTNKITGTPTTPGTYTIKIKAKDSAGNESEQEFKITITSPSNNNGGNNSGGNNGNNNSNNNTTKPTPGPGGGSYVAPTPTNPIPPTNPTIPNNPNNNSNNNTSNQNNNNSNNTNHTKPIITPEGTLSTQQGVTPSTQTTPSGQKIYNLSNRVTDYICPAIVQAYPYNELVVQDISNSSFQDDISALMMFRGMEKDEMNLGQTYQEYKKYGVVNNVAQFQPNRNVTRAEFVKMLVRSLSCRYTYLGTDTGFPDVDQSQWYAEYIKFAVENKWINGYKDGNFRPNAPITRDEAAKILTRAIQLSTQNSNYTTSFSDVPASSEFIPYIETLKSHGIMKGRNSNTFAPKEFIPRTETSRMIYRIFFGGNI